MHDEYIRIVDGADRAMKHFINPLVSPDKYPTGVTWDPYIIKHEGKYYHCYAIKEGVFVAVCDHLSDLDKAERYKVYSCPDEGVDSAWYAPELHLIDGIWYIYGSPCIGGTCHCMTVLRAKDDSPVGEYENIGMINPIDNQWNLDGTVFEHKGKFYFAWSSGDKIHISELVSPTQLGDLQSVIVKAELPFETVSGPVCEAPAILKRNGRIYMIYSVNESGKDDYCMGQITFTGGDILNPAAWIKKPIAVFEQTEDIFGPGHCSFTEGDAPDEIYMVYHANLESGSGWYGRHIWAQKVEWDQNGEPVFGVPHR